MKPPDGEALRVLASGIDEMVELCGAGIAFIGDERCVDATPLTKPALKELIRAGTIASRFSAAQINRRIFLQLADTISAVLEYTGSATSGNLKGLYVHIVQE